MYIKENEWTEQDDCYELQIQYKNDEYRSTYIDKDDYIRTSKKQWRTSHKGVNGSKIYVISGSPAKKNMLYLPYFILKIKPKKGLEIDHLDGNSLNNKKDNLKLVSRLENIQNTSVRRDNTTSGIRGVSFDKFHNVWVVDFSFNKRRYYVKWFKIKEEAIYLRYLFEKHYNLNIMSKLKFYNKILESFTRINRNEIEEYFEYAIQR
jgi:hypothetical protein